jgi:hypothetical protein
MSHDPESAYKARLCAQMMAATHHAAANTGGDRPVVSLDNR